MAFRNEVVDGVNMLLSVNDTVIGSSSTCSVEITRATRSTSSKDTGIWDSFAAGTMTWTMTSENFVNFAGQNGFDEMYEAMVSGNPVSVACAYDQDGEGTDTFKLAGEAIITSLPLSAPKGENISFSITFQGTGELVKTKLTA